jgi:hypothetical protein
MAGSLKLDWGKNYGFINHSSLFLPSDKKNISYHYADGIVENKPGHSSPLIMVKGRLDLCGYSLGSLKLLYEQYRDPYEGSNILPFELVAQLLVNVDLNKYKPAEEYDELARGNFIFGEIADIPELKQFQEETGVSDYDIAYELELIGAYILLRLFAENPQNKNVNIEWQSYDLIEAGWATEEEIFAEVDEKSKFLIVTEGSSDTLIIEKALQLLRPDIADFFSFVDMHNNYPFTGTGNLYNFCQGLVKIKVQNKILVIFDNDVEGNDKFEKVKKLDLPDNMRVMTLPYYADFEDFKTIGPSGETIENINGKAVAIECFLDFFFKNHELPRIRWTNYSMHHDCYQGSLINKDDFVREFKSIRLVGSAYNFSKLNVLIDHIVSACIQF